MISILTISTVLMAKYAFFFPFAAMGESQDDHDKKTEDFLNFDGFQAETIRDVENSLFLKELQRLKDVYRENYLLSEDEQVILLNDVQNDRNWFGCADSSLNNYFVQTND